MVEFRRPKLIHHQNFFPQGTLLVFSEKTEFIFTRSIAYLKRQSGTTKTPILVSTNHFASLNQA